MDVYKTVTPTTSGVLHRTSWSRISLHLLSTLALYTSSTWGQRSECTLYNGRCLYHIELSQGCSPSGSTHTNKIQNDYDQKVNEIERSLTDVRDDHSRRITELENTITTLLGGADRGSNPRIHVIEEDINNINVDETAHPHGRRHKNHFEEDPNRNEIDLLNALHNEFSGLRNDLASTKKKLRHTERTLQDTRIKLNSTQIMLIDTTKKLLKTERDLDEAKNENARLKEDLARTNRELNETRTQLADALAELRRKERELFDVKYENQRLRKELDDLKRLLEFTRKALANALRKYHDLNIRHDALHQELNQTREELVVCFRGKTSMFCGFEDEEVCGFTQDNETDFFDWSRNKKYTTTSRTGPRADHTCGNKKGYYMYAEASSKGPLQNARLISPKYAGVGEQCIEFFYHMYGVNTGTLNVYTLVPRQDVVPLWRAYGDQGDVWTSARIHIPEEVAQKSYQVVFEVILEKGYRGDIAIDDFRVFDGPCMVIKTAEQYFKELAAAGNLTTTTTPLPQPVANARYP